MIPYVRPPRWLQYRSEPLVDALTRAKAAVLSLQTVPFQRRWVDALQGMELKREVAGTSRIEGAEFTDRELETAMKPETDDELHTRSQRQARAALRAYEWIRTVRVDRPVDREVVLQIHRLVVQGADDDHCVPGQLRESGQNVTFGTPPHRGVAGGAECEAAFLALTEAFQGEFRAHDPLIQAIAAHYHIAAMHPFLDGNGRTARALEALLLGRAGLRDATFIAMSNYYYDEKVEYLKALAEVRSGGHDLTPFLRFALLGVEKQARRLLAEIQKQIKRELVSNLMRDLSRRLTSPRKRVIAERQLGLLEILLPVDSLSWGELQSRGMAGYRRLKSPEKAFIRDINGLFALGVLRVDRGPDDSARFSVDLDWPAKITESEFFKRVQELPKTRGTPFDR